ncbi:MAG TPA: hypothetical protein VMS17_05715 [Gemmataceae bacterium]|nr:hypothetical protein [Gemmataceae bacterium]
MKAILCRLTAVLIAAGFSSVVHAADKLNSSDIPTPDWVKMIDQGGADPRLKGYKTPEGVKVEIVAEDPVVINPRALAFTDEGTPFVLEVKRSYKPYVIYSGPGKTVTFTYKDGTTRTMVLGGLKEPGRDVIKALNDSTGKGVYDQSKVVFEDDMISDILLRGGWLYTAGAGFVRRSSQGRPNGTYDVKEVVAQGLGIDVDWFNIGEFDDDYGMALGSDGRLYIAAGGKQNYVEGSDGSRATVLKSGAVFRCRPDGSQLEMYALVLAMSPRSLEKLTPLLDAGCAAAGGLLVYNDTRFPENYRGLVFAPDLTGAVHACKVERKGAAFAVTEQFDLLKRNDDFKPVQLVLGPDGAIYIADCRDEMHGRILRLTWTGTKEQPALPPRPMDSWAKIIKLGDDDLVKALASEDGSDRDHARQELVRRGEKNRAAILKLFKDAGQPDPPRIAALGALESIWNDDVQAAMLFVLVHDSSADLRRLAADAVGLNVAKGDDKVHAILLQGLNDPAPEVRRSIALAMSRVAADGAADNLVNTWAVDDGRDAYLSDGLVRAIENLGQPGIDRLIALGESGVQKETDKVVQAFTMMRTRPAADAIPRLLENPHLKPEQRAAVVRSYENYLLDPPVSLAPMVDYLIAHPKEDAAVKQAGVEALASGGGAAGEKAAGWLIGLFDEKDPKLRSAAVAALAGLNISAEDARRAGQAYLDKKLPPETRPKVADILRRQVEEDAECARLLKEIGEK